MPVNFAFVASCGNAGAHFKGSQMQFQVVEILGMTRNLGPKDASGGKIAAMAAGGIDDRPGAPSIADQSLLFVVNVYYTFDLPEAQRTAGKEGLVIEILLAQKFYAVTSVLNARPGGSPAASWPPFAAKVIGAPKDLTKIILGSAPPRPITPPSDLGVPADARIASAFASTSGGAAYANVPGDAVYANNGGGNSANGYGTIIPYVPDPAAEMALATPPGPGGVYGLPIYRPQLG